MVKLLAGSGTNADQLYRECNDVRYITRIRGPLWSIVGYATATTVVTALAPVDLNHRSEIRGTPDTLGYSFEFLLLVKDGVSRPRMPICDTTA